MARKPSVIMSAGERKQAANDLSAEIKNTKADLKSANDKIKDLEKQLKAATKDRDAVAKTLNGLETRKAALNPPKPILTQGAVA